MQTAAPHSGCHNMLCLPLCSQNSWLQDSLRASSIGEAVIAIAVASNLTSSACPMKAASFSTFPCRRKTSGNPCASRSVSLLWAVLSLEQLLLAAILTTLCRQFLRLCFARALLLLSSGFQHAASSNAQNFTRVVAHNINTSSFATSLSAFSDFCCSKLSCYFLCISYLLCVQNTDSDISWHARPFWGSLQPNPLVSQYSSGENNSCQP